MSLATAHKILITIAIAFFVVYALWELGQYRQSGEDEALGLSVAGSVTAVALVFYLRRFIRRSLDAS